MKFSAMLLKQVDQLLVQQKMETMEGNVEPLVTLYFWASEHK